MASMLNIDLNDLIISQLECPLCFEICKPPIYMCINGHNVCSACHARVTQCSICKDDKPSGRNRMAEELSITVLRPCENQDRGCESRYCIKDLEEHLLCCQFGYQCQIHEAKDPKATCFWKGSLANLKEHAVKFHVAKFLVRNDDERPVTWQFNLSKSYETVALLEFDDVLFWCVMRYNCEDKIFSGFVRFVGKDATAAKYRCRFSFGKDGKDLCYSCDVLSLHQDVLRRNSEMLCGEIVDAFADNNYLKCDLFVFKWSGLKAERPTEVQEGDD